MEEKRRKNMGNWIFIFGIFLFLVVGVSAKFVCGEVYYQGQITPSWYDVRIYLYSNFAIYSECKVSPDDFKYCCEVDLKRMPNGTWVSGWNWNGGDFVGAEIIDYGLGLMAGPTWGVLSGEGYDVLAPMELREVVQVKNPDRGLIINNKSSFVFEANVFDDCDFFSLNNGSKDLLCEGGCDYVNEFGVDYGLVNKEFFSECGGHNFSRNVSFYLVERVDFESSLENKIKKDRKVKVDLKGVISEEVENLEFREYVPVEFEISDISKGGYVEISSSSYNVVVWGVDGKEFDFSYSVSSSINGDFYVISEFGGNVLRENFVNVYNYISSSEGKKKKNQGGGGYKYIPKNFSIVNNNLPLIEELGDMTLALYSNNFTEKGASELFYLNFSNKIYNRSLKYFDSYLVETNLGNNFGKFAFEYEFNESDLKKEGYNGIEFYGKDGKGKLIPLTGNFVKLEDVEKYSFVGDEFFREIIIFGVKEKLTLWDRFIEWSWKLFGNKTRIVG